MAVYVPVAESVRFPAIFNVVVPKVNEVVPKLRFLNQPPVFSVATDAPVVNVKFGALVESPALLPQLNVLVLLIAATVNPPDPVYVKLVRVAILNTVVAAVVCVSCILPALALPNCIERVFELLELNIPVLNVTPSANVNVPAVSV